MIFKVLYQQNTKSNPKREFTQSLYLDCESEVQARELVDKNTDYNIEFIETLVGNHLAYEQKNPDFKITEFK